MQLICKDTLAGDFERDLGGLFFMSGEGDLDFDIDLERDRLGDLLQ